MSTGLRIFFAVLTLLATLAALTLGLFGFFGHDNSGHHMIGLGVVGLALTALFSFFVYHDYMFFFGGQKAAQLGTPPAPASTAEPVPSTPNEVNKS